MDFDWQDSIMLSEESLSVMIRQESLAVKQQLCQTHRTLSVAESCTGGMLGSFLTDIPQSSSYFWGGVLCYSNTAKQLLLNVKEKTLRDYGAVSEQVALEMVQGLFDLSKSDICISVTGIAGPTGGSLKKPIGTVWTAYRQNDVFDTQCFLTSGTRVFIKQMSCLKILRFINLSREDLI